MTSGVTSGQAHRPVGPGHDARHAGGRHCIGCDEPYASVGRVAAKVLGALGALNIGGYAGERVVRERLRPSGWDHVEAPVAVVSLALATAMAALGLGRGRGSLTQSAVGRW